MFAALDGTNRLFRRWLSSSICEKGESIVRTQSSLKWGLLVGAAVTLAACGGDNESDDEAAAAEPDPAPAAEPDLAEAEPPALPEPQDENGAASGVPAPADEDVASADGQVIYASAGCAGCHGSEGGGASGPALADNANLEDATFVVTQILEGGDVMPPFADRLSDEDVAAVANYIRNAWDNSAAEAIEPDDVAALR